jgi:2-polyprenyl-3-methyl-5-hydroxy-6-metoxy-1,4-benzoquinol methylase
MSKNKKTELIGKVNLDLTNYNESFDAQPEPVLEELLCAVQNSSEEELSVIVEQKKNWPFYYHLSPLRQNIVEWVPMNGNQKIKVLEIGSECGAVTGALLKKADQVDCVEVSKQMSLVNAYRHKDAENLSIYVGDLGEVEDRLDSAYDFIFLVGTLEHSTRYLNADDPYEGILKIAMRHLAPEGHIILATANKYGMKYFAGCKEDSLGEYFAGIENNGG